MGMFGPRSAGLELQDADGTVWVNDQAVDAAPHDHAGLAGRDKGKRDLEVRLPRRQPGADIGAPGHLQKRPGDVFEEPGTVRHIHEFFRTREPSQMIDHFGYAWRRLPFEGKDTVNQSPGHALE